MIPSAPALARALAVLHRVEDGALALLLGAMILLAPAQIAMRTLFDASIAWGDPMLRMLVLWVGLLGALAASRGDRQIRVDVLSRLASPRLAAAAAVMTAAFTAGVAGLVAWHAARLVLSEYAFGGTAFAGVPVWLCLSVVPFAFALIALRHGLGCVRAAADLRRGAPHAP
jgi:TRAP-type C4-dicarboxylate transport system permease small subunit